MDRARKMASLRRRSTDIALEEKLVPSSEELTEWILFAEQCLSTDILLLTPKFIKQLEKGLHIPLLVQLLDTAMRSPSKPANLPWIYVNLLYKASESAANSEHVEANSLAINYRISKLIRRMPRGSREILQTTLVPQSWALVFKTVDKIQGKNKRRFDKSAPLVEKVITAMMLWNVPLGFQPQLLKIFYSINVDIANLDADCDLEHLLVERIRDPYVKTILDEAREMARALLLSFAHLSLLRALPIQDDVLSFYQNVSRDDYYPKSSINVLVNVVPDVSRSVLLNGKRPQLPHHRMENKKIFFAKQIAQFSEAPIIYIEDEETNSVTSDDLPPRGKRGSHFIAHPEQEIPQRHVVRRMSGYNVGESDTDVDHATDEGEDAGQEDDNDEEYGSGNGHYATQSQSTQDNNVDEYVEDPDDPEYEPQRHFYSVEESQDADEDEDEEDANYLAAEYAKKIKFIDLPMHHHISPSPSPMSPNPTPSPSSLTSPHLSPQSTQQQLAVFPRQQSQENSQPVPPQPQPAQPQQQQQVGRTSLHPNDAFGTSIAWSKKPRASDEVLVYL